VELAQRAERLFKSWGPARRKPRGNTLEGSNPSLSARFLVAPLAVALVAQTPSPGRHIVSNRFVLPAILKATATASSDNLVSNGNFEGGKIDEGWIECGTQPAYVTIGPARAGSFALYSGTRDGRGEPDGDSGVCQAVRVPAGAVLTAELYQLSNEPDARFAYQEADLLDQRGNIVVNLYRAANDSPRWTRGSWNLGAYAGNTYWLYFGVHGDGYAKATTQQFVTKVMLTGSASPRPE